MASSHRAMLGKSKSPPMTKTLKQSQPSVATTLNPEASMQGLARKRSNPRPVPQKESIVPKKSLVKSNSTTEVVRKLSSGPEQSANQYVSQKSVKSSQKGKQKPKKKVICEEPTDRLPRTYGKQTSEALFRKASKISARPTISAMPLSIEEVEGQDGSQSHRIKVDLEDEAIHKLTESMTPTKEKKQLEFTKALSMLVNEFDNKVDNNSPDTKQAVEATEKPPEKEEKQSLPRKLNFKKAVLNERIEKLPLKIEPPQLYSEDRNQSGTEVVNQPYEAQKEIEHPTLSSIESTDVKVQQDQHLNELRTIIKQHLNAELMPQLVESSLAAEIDLMEADEEEREEEPMALAPQTVQPAPLVEKLEAQSKQKDQPRIAQCQPEAVESIQLDQASDELQQRPEIPEVPIVQTTENEPKPFEDASQQPIAIPQNPVSEEPEQALPKPADIQTPQPPQSIPEPVEQSIPAMDGISCIPLNASVNHSLISHAQVEQTVEVRPRPIIPPPPRRTNKQSLKAVLTEQHLRMGKRTTQPRKESTPPKRQEDLTERRNSFVRDNFFKKKLQEVADEHMYPLSPSRNQKDRQLANKNSHRTPEEHLLSISRSQELISMADLKKRLEESVDQIRSNSLERSRYRSFVRMSSTMQNSRQSTRTQLLEDIDFYVSRMLEDRPANYHAHHGAPVAYGIAADKINVHTSEVSDNFILAKIGSVLKVNCRQSRQHILEELYGCDEVLLTHLPKQSASHRLAKLRQRIRNISKHAQNQLRDSAEFEGEELDHRLEESKNLLGEVEALQQRIKCSLSESYDASPAMLGDLFASVGINSHLFEPASNSDPPTLECQATFNRLLIERLVARLDSTPQ